MKEEKSGFGGGPALDTQAGPVCVMTRVDATCACGCVSSVAVSTPPGAGFQWACCPRWPQGFGTMATISGADADEVPVLACPPTFEGFISEVGSLSV